MKNPFEHRRKALEPITSLYKPVICPHCPQKGITIARELDGALTRGVVGVGLVHQAAVAVVGAHYLEVAQSE